MEQTPTGTSRTIGIGLLVYLLATILMAIFYTIGILYGAIKSLYKRQIGSGAAAIDNKLFTMAVMKDQTGNIVCAELFNLLLIKKESIYKFGEKDETISSVLGKNLQVNTLSSTGLWLADILDSIQPNHCIKSINK